MMPEAVNDQQSLPQQKDNARQSTPITGTRLLVQTHWYSLSEAAGLLGISETAVRKRITDRSLTGVRAGRNWRILLPGEPRQASSDLQNGSRDLVASRGDSPDTESLVVLVRDLQRQNLALAGHIGFVQSQLARAREDLKLLEERRADAVEHESPGVSREEHEATVRANEGLRRKVAELKAERVRQPPASIETTHRRWWPFKR